MLARLTKVVFEFVLEGEMDDHLGYASMIRLGATAEFAEWDAVENSGD